MVVREGAMTGVELMGVENDSDRERLAPIYPPLKNTVRIYSVLAEIRAER